MDIQLPANAQKSQLVRLVDVFLLGPGLVYVGYKQKDKRFRTFLIASGVATIIYNWRNYSRVCDAVRTRAYDMATQPANFESWLGCKFLT